jgi:hypothetical protein
VPETKEKDGPLRRLFKKVTPDAVEQEPADVYTPPAAELLKEAEQAPAAESLRQMLAEAESVRAVTKTPAKPATARKTVTKQAPARKAAARKTAA